MLNDPNASEAMSLSRKRLLDRLAAAGLRAEQGDVTEGVMGAAPQDADVIFACCKPDIGLLKHQMPSLSWVQVISAGVDQVLPKLAPGVLLTNSSGVHAAKGGEFVLTAALMLVYRIPAFVADKDVRRWQPEFVTPAAGKRVTLLGVGGIGGAAAGRLRQNDFHVIGVTRSGVSNVALDGSIPVGRLDEVLSQTDILVSTLPSTPATRNLIDRRRLSALPRRAGIVVVGRAAVVDYDAMADLLRSDHLSGAVLDVFPVEPLPASDNLWSCPNVIMTPHCSVDDHATYIDGCLDIFIDNVARFRDGQPLRNLVDPALGY